MSLFRSRVPLPTADELFHIYTTDLVQLNKLRQQAWEVLTIKKSPQAAGEIARYDSMIEVAQKTILKIKDTEVKRDNQ